MIKLYYVDPMSYNNLSLYDWNLIDNLEADVYFFGSKEYDYKTLKAKANLCYNYNRKASKLLKVLFYISNSLCLLKNIVIHNPDIIHFQWLKMPLFDIILIRLIKLFSKNSKIVFTAHNFLPHDTGNRYLKHLKYVYKSVDSIIVHSESTQVKINNLIRDDSKTTLIKHGIIQMDYNQSDVETIKKRIIERHNLKNSLICLNIGQIHYYKGVDILVDAWNSSDLLSNNNMISLIVTGKGDPKLINNKARNVIIENRFLSNDEFVAYMELADLVILPYRNISQSGVLLTTLSFKKPILVSNVGGLAEPLKYAKIGWVLEDLKGETVANKIIDILSNKKDLNQIKNDKMAWSIIEDEYSWQKVGKDTCDLYSKLLS